MTLLLALLALAGDPLAGAFPFAMPPVYDLAGYVDMGYLSPEPCGSHGRLVVRDGTFVDGRGQRVRLLGTNLTFATAFPSKDLAPKIAERMKRLGMNVVRLHHMDNGTTPRGLWADTTQKALDPGQMDRLDFLISEFRRCGIWVNLNLHVSRNYAGYDWSKLPTTFNYGKTVDHYHPDLIRMQHEYARLILGHRNPYTGNTYATEPTIAFVELNNENSLTGQAGNGQLLQLPPALLDPLEAGWRGYVKQRYSTLEAARRAWTAGLEPLGAELLTNRDLADGTKGWVLEAPKPAEASLTVVDGPDGRRALRADLTRPGVEAWHFQVHQVGMDLTEGADYTVEFWGRANANRPIYVGCRVDQADWHGIGQTATITLTPEWKRHTFSLHATTVVPRHTRLSFGLNSVVGTVELAGMSLRRGVPTDLPAGTTLDTLPLPIGRALPREAADWTAYVTKTERDYVVGLRDLVKKTIGCGALVICSQASYGGTIGLAREADLSDYVDMHAYWQHPRFPGRPWDSADWSIANTPIVAAADGGALGGLVANRVAGKPYSVSEYDHPAPSFYTAEAMPLLAAVAGRQNWDALYQFDYGDSVVAGPPKIRGYFESVTNPAKMALMPIAAVLFRAGAMPAAGIVHRLTVSRAVLARGGSMGSLWQAAGLAAGAMVADGRAEVALVDGDAAPKLSTGAGQGSTSLVWQSAPAEQAHYRVDTPQVAAVVGRIGGRKVTAGPLTVALHPTERNFATVALAALDGQALAESAKLLLVVVGAVGNTGMGWNDTLTSVGRAWGTGPTVCEPLTADLDLALGTARRRVRVLDGAGQPGAVVPSRPSAGGLGVTVSPDQQTIWYAIDKE
ncbi:MAG: carbohydrate binding domain-containing protein [Armatimonadetes bacterium]|nr:carbohydrate binding domain-containing protein [Armatimonadota bacterium]